MLGRNREDRGETEFAELQRQRVQSGSVALVDSYADRSPGLPKELGQIVVGRCEFRSPVDDEDHFVGVFDGVSYLFAD